MKLGRIGAIALLAALATACGHKPPKPSPTHIRSEEARAQGDIPPPVQVSPILPKPKPAARPETASLGAMFGTVTLERVAAQQKVAV